jgi:hypothetical protein
LAHLRAQAHFESVFRTMRTGWGCTYFKLDANFWGAIHGGRFHDPKATRIEAYRRGMEAVRRGAGEAFLLGCNHPIWGSLGLLHGSRSSNDIKRTWDRVARTARENLGRNWQNGRLWWNDPDAVVLAGDLGEEERSFHATAILATGGMVLYGDDLSTIPPTRLEMLRKLHPPTGVAARFEDDSLGGRRRPVGPAPRVPAQLGRRPADAVVPPAVGAPRPRAVDRGRAKARVGRRGADAGPLGTRARLHAAGLGRPRRPRRGRLRP